jgi:hypothetical protein
LPPRCSQSEQSRDRPRLSCEPQIARVLQDSESICRNGVTVP